MSPIERINRLCTKIALIAAFFNPVALAFGQDIKVVLGPDEIGENQAWTITVTVNNDRLRNYDVFPDVDGFRKGGTSTQSQTSIVNGQISSSQSVVMSYIPTKQGTFTIPSFKMKVNNEIVSITGKKVKVSAPVQVRSNDPFRSLFDRDPMRDMFGSNEGEFEDIKEDALLALTTSKDEVYVGEGFTTTLSFLVADNNRAPMQFYELGKQLADILKKIRPSTCWEENFNIENIEGEPVMIGNRGYTQYKIYQATFFPLNNKPVQFPGVGLEMIKFKVAKNPSFFGQNRKEDFKTFYSKTKTVKVKDLPPHPLRDAVAVGDYRHEEKLASIEMQTGQSVAYDFTVYGEGNISAVEKPAVTRDANFDFYEPNIRQSINREKGRVTGNKSFSYFIIPKEPGSYHLGDYYKWIFFNTKTEKYDTLKSQQMVHVTGESQKNLAIESNDLGSFYNRINAADASLKNISGVDMAKVGVNIFVFLIFSASLFLLFKK